MKTERRHELQTNELADSLGRFIEQSKPHWPSIAGGIILVIVVIVGMSYYSNRQKQVEAEGWEQYEIFTSPAYERQLTEIREEKLQKQYNDENRQITTAEREEIRELINSDIAALAEAYKGYTVATFAHLNLGDDALRRGIDLLFTDPATATVHLDTAIEHFESARSETKDPMLLRMAELGLAEAYETRNQRSQKDQNADDLKEAQRLYEKLAADDSLFKSIAEQRLAEIKNDGQFYTWFDEVLQSRKRSFTEPDERPPFELPGSGSSFDLPGGGSSLSDFGTNSSDSGSSTDSSTDGTDNGTPDSSTPSSGTPE